MHSIFRLAKLQCSYGKELPIVLRIDQLELPSGKLIFLLGSSGTGKSTLLETLGLMNNTIAKGEVLFFPLENEIFNFGDLWQSQSEEKIASLRRRYFNFIFQNTNLMENFTAYENVCIAGMIKQARDQSEMLGPVKELMERVRLPEHEVSIGTLAMNLSGGQRQRLAFVRALSSNSKVLLCDEPTGNLDEANANELFEVIREGLSDGLTAIVVSHDIALAVKHADQIILLTKEIEKGYGEIEPGNVFQREDWQNFSKDKLDAFKAGIRKTFIAGAEHVIERNESKSEPKIGKTSFRQLFFTRESKALAGKHYTNFGVLCLLFLFSFIAIGFGNGSLLYLKNTLGNAFVNWLTISVPNGRSDKSGDLKLVIDDLNLEYNQKRFHIDSVSTYKVGTLELYNPRTKDTLVVKGRTFDVDRDRKFIHEELLSKKHMLHGESTFTDSKDMSVIVTPKFLETYGYPTDTNFISIVVPIYTNVNDDLEGDVLMPVPVRAIVDELPDKHMLAFTEYFYQAYLLKFSGPFNPDKHRFDLDYFISTDTVEATKIFSLLKHLFQNNLVAKKYSPNDPEELFRHYRSFADGFDVTLSLLSPDVPSFRTIDTINKTILQSSEMAPYNKKVHRFVDYPVVDETYMKALRVDALSVYFKGRLDSVRALKKFVDESYNTAAQKESGNVISVDMNKVQDKEHFMFLSSVAFVISYLIIVFGSISVSLFIYNLLKMHLSKVKMNIGTFKAIGLPNNESRNIYFLIVILFVLVSIVISLAIASIAGFGIDLLLKSQLSLDQQSSYFNIISINTGIAIAAFLISSTIVSYFTINRILSKSPGDLIYNR